MLGHDAAFHQMLVNDPFQYGRIAFAVPGALWIHDGDWTTLANAQAVGFRAQDTALFGKFQLLEPPLQKIPCSEAAVLVAAFRVGLVAAQKNMPPRDWHADACRDFTLRFDAQNSVTSTNSPCSTMSIAAAISKYPSACDMLVMSPDAL